MKDLERPAHFGISAGACGAEVGGAPLKEWSGGFQRREVIRAVFRAITLLLCGGLAG